MTNDQEKKRAERTLKIQRSFAVSAERLYDAWLDPTSVRQWMCPGDTSVSLAEMDVREGGRFRIVMQSGSDLIEHTGEYVLLERPKSIIFTWRSVNTLQRPTLVTLKFEPEGNKNTKLTLIQEQLPGKDAEDKHRFGWTDIFKKLENAFRDSVGK